MYGEWMVGFAGFCGITTNINAELLAIYYGHTLAWNKGYKDVICESDSKIAISLVTQGCHKAHPYAPLINQIRKFQTSSWRLQFKHTLREGNFYADWLAKYGANSDVAFATWNDCLHQLDSLLLADAICFVILG